MIVAIVSKKGGVGKSTTSTSLAAALAERGERTLLVDLDPQGSSSLSLGVARADFAPSVGDMVLGNMTAQEVVRRTHVPNLDLITASTDLTHADQTLAGLRRRETILAKKIDPIRDEYDFILIDCPPSLSLLPTAALVAADAYLVPTLPHFLAIEGIENLLSAVDRLGTRVGSKTRLLGIALTAVDYRTRLTRTNVEAIRKRFGEDVFAIEVRTNVRLAEAPEFGQTIFQYAPDSTGANAYRLLAEEMVMRARPEVELSAPAGELSDTASHDIVAAAVETLEQAVGAPPDPAATPEVVTRLAPANDAEPLSATDRFEGRKQPSATPEPRPDDDESDGDALVERPAASVENDELRFPWPFPISPVTN